MCERVICLNTKVNTRRATELTGNRKFQEHTHTHFHKKKFPQCLQAFSAAVRLCFVFCPLIHPSLHPFFIRSRCSHPQTVSQGQGQTPNHHYKQPQRESDTPRQRGSRREEGSRGINAIPEISMHMSKGVIKKLSRF